MPITDKMWRRAYFALALVRLYFAMSPSYLHPDEHFQGPEVIAGHIFSYPVTKTWEFTSATPIRSIFALWPVYGLPMLILKWLWEGSGNGPVTPAMVFWTLRLLMFALSFVLQDWAIYELVEVPRQRRLAIMLVASSYVTWTWQVHTFSNAIESLVVTWSLVLIKRVTEVKAHRSGALASAVLAFLLVFGTFNRITFPAFVIGPGVQAAVKVWRRPSVWVTMLVVAAMTTLLAITVDTAFYHTGIMDLSDLFHSPIITPLNNLIYNSQSSNLALHGTHPFYQHFLANLPQLIGPAFPLIFIFGRQSTALVAAFSSVLLLSCFPHQEARFLLPAVPLFLCSVRLPRRFTRVWVTSWIVFNVFLGLLMGVYHQGGIVDAQLYLSRQTDVTCAYWWKTYSPPTWLLGENGAAITTVDLMGLDRHLLEHRICNDSISDNTRVLVAPYSADFLDKFSGLREEDSAAGLRLKELWRMTNHVNLDDLDFGDDGVQSTLNRVVGRRGLVVWSISCVAEPPPPPPPVHLAMLRDW